MFTQRRCITLVTAAGFLTAAGAVLLWWCFPRPLLQNVVGMYDHWMVTVPYAYFFDYSLHHDRTFPLWYPLMMCGRPFAAYAGIGLFYPLYLVRALLTWHPSALHACYGMAALTVFHMLLAGLGAFLLSRRHSLSYWASLTSAVAFMLSAAFVRRSLAHWTFAATAAWLPWLIVAVEIMLAMPTPRRRLRAALAGGLLFAVPVLAGNTQLLYYTGIAIIVYVLLYRALCQDCHRFRSVGSDVWFLGVFFAVPVLIGMVMFLPAAEFAGLSARVKGAFAWAGDAVSERGPLDLWEGLVLYGARWFPERLRWCGAGVFLLAVSALAHAKGHRVALLGFWLLALFDIGVGRPMPLAALTDAVSPFAFSNPARISILACLPLALLAGYGVDAARDAAPRRRRAAAGIVLLLCAAGAGATLAARILAQRMLFHISPVAFAAPMLVAAIAGLTLWRPRISNGVRWAFPLLVLVEILAWNREFVPYLYRMTEVSAPSIEDLAAPSALWQGNRRGPDPEPLEVNRPLLALQPVIGGYDPLYLRVVYNVLCAPGEENMYSRFVTATSGEGQTNRRYGQFLSRAFWLAPAYAVGSLPAKDSVYPAAAAVFLPEDPGVSMPRLDAVPQASTPDEDALIRIRRRTANRVSLTCGPLAEPRLLLFVDADYSGWLAKIDGAGVPIYRANEVFKAVYLPAGTHDVEFQFVSPRFRWGLGVSIVSMVGALSAFLYLLRNPQPRRQEH